MPKVITKYFSRKIANAVQTELSSNIYYFAVSKHSEYTDENNPEDALNTTEYMNKFQRELILGKRIKASDVTNLLDRHSWQQDSVYAQYDDTDQYMYDKEFYVINGS